MIFHRKLIKYRLYLQYYCYNTHDIADFDTLNYTVEMFG